MKGSASDYCPDCGEHWPSHRLYGAPWCVQSPRPIRGAVRWAFRRWLFTRNRFARVWAALRGA